MSTRKRTTFTCTKVAAILPTLSAVQAELTAKVNALALDSVEFRILSQERWTEERTANAERHYRDFLILAGLKPGQSMVPLGDVDTFWHYHILDTMKYAQDCMSVLGYFLHHNPNFGRNPEDQNSLAEATDQTRNLYAEVFGFVPDGLSATCIKAGGIVKI